MDLLQIALVFLILLLAILLSILGVQVFLILRDLRRAMDKIDLILGDAKGIAENIQRPIQAAADLTSAVEAGVQMAKVIGGRIAPKIEKPAKKMFKVRSR